MKDKDRRGPPGCRAEPPPRPPLRCGGTRNGGVGNGGARGARPLRASPLLSASSPPRGRFPWPGLGGAPPRGTAAPPACTRGGLRARAAGRAKPAQPSEGGHGAVRAREGCPAARHSPRGGGKGARGEPPGAHACLRARSGVGGAAGVGWVGAQRRSVPRCHEGSRTVAMGLEGREIKHGPLVPTGLRVVWAFLRISPQGESQHPRWGWTTLSSRQRGHPSQIHPQNC